VIVSSPRIQIREGSTASRRLGTNARLREQTLTARRAEVRGQILEKAGSLGTRLGLVALALVVVASAGWYGWKSFTASRFASLADIEVKGMVRMGASDVAVISGLKAGKPLAKLDLDALRRKLEADPWIADAKVSRSWPRRVSIELVERVPVARLGTGRWVAVDGVLLSPRGSEVFPLLVGQGYKDGRIPMKRAAESLAGLLQMERSGWISRIEQVALVPDGSMELRLSGIAPKVLVASGDWKRSFARVGALRAELGDELSLFSAIDLRHGSCAALRRADGGV
jgi:cell division protein FtsQ